MKKKMRGVVFSKNIWDGASERRNDPKKSLTKVKI
jgi:hypothetical protein